MVFPNKEGGSSDETEATGKFFLKLRQLTAQPPLSEEFYQRLRENIKNIPSSPGETAQEYEIPMPPPSARKVAASEVTKQTNWWKSIYFFRVAATTLGVIICAFLLPVILTNIEHSSLPYYMNHFFTQGPSTQELQSHISTISSQLQEIERTLKTLETLEASASLKEKMDEDKLQKPANMPSVNDERDTISIEIDGDSHVYYVDEETLKIIQSAIKEHYNKHLSEERNKGQ